MVSALLRIFGVFDVLYEPGNGGAQEASIAVEFGAASVEKASWNAERANRMRAKGMRESCFLMTIMSRRTKNARWMY